MCGICGKLVWNTRNAVSADLLMRMNDALTHRGPDDAGRFTARFNGARSGVSGSVGLAMRRLSIIDVAGGRQPIFNENDTVGVVYNGETYNHADLRAELTTLGHTFKTRADTEVLVHGYEVWGDDMPGKLNGMFAFALWDGARRRLLLARDRLGIKPLYYAVTPNRLVFASEIKAILEDPEVSREIDPAAVNDYFSMRYVPTPRSIYRDIRKLEPGTLLIWEGGRVTFKRYWNFQPSGKRDRGLRHYLAKADGLLADAVRRQMISEVPIGTFLSGGIDSPTIAYYAKKVKPDLTTFNMYFAEKSFSERDEASAVARALGTEHFEAEVRPDVAAVIPALVSIFDEPFGDDSMIPTYFLTKLARAHMTVALSGDGGDELFGGYPTYLADRAAGWYRHTPRPTDDLFRWAAGHLPVSFDRYSFDYKVRAFLRAARRPSPLEHFGWTEIFDRQSKMDLFTPAFWASIKGQTDAESFRDAFEDAGGRRGLERFLFVDQRTHLQDEFLVKMDRLSMAHSLEVRPPFLDHRLVEWAAELPIRYKLRGWTTKWLLRRLMRGRVPDAIIRGVKKGFAPPMAHWLAGDLLGYARQKLAPERIRAIPYLRPDAPAALLERHARRETNLARPIWTILMFVEWYDRKILNRD